MAKGYQQHQERLQSLSLLGKPLARRAASKCELCETPGRSLTIYEVPPVPAEPDLDHCIFICEPCRTQLEKPKQRDPHTLRPLTSTVWSNIPAVQVTAYRLLKEIAPTTDWARESLEYLELPPEIQAWADKP